MKMKCNFYTLQRFHLLRGGCPILVSERFRNMFLINEGNVPHLLSKTNNYKNDNTAASFYPGVPCNPTFAYPHISA